MDKEYLLKKWLNDDLTPEEALRFKEMDDYAINQSIIKNAHAFKASNFTDVKSFKDFKNQYSKSREPVKRLNWKSPFLKIASILVLALCVYSAYYFNASTNLKTATAQKIQFELPDASLVTLNSVSEISFNKRNWNSSRKIALKGEAFFKVSKGNSFEVITSSGIVTVVGTEFNVKQRQNFFFVECYEGIVSVKSDSITRTLHAGDSFKIYNGLFSESHSKILAPEWIDKSSTFHAIALKDVLSELERQYSIEIIHEDINIEKLFTGGFPHDNLKQALISITQPMNLKYKINSSNRVVLYEIKD